MSTKTNLPSWWNPRTLIEGSVFYGLILVLSFPILGAQIYATDVWKALYSGRYLTWFHHFPHHSTFTFSPVKEALVRDGFNWLGNLFIFGTYDLIGINGVQLLRPLMAIIAVTLVHGLMKGRRNTWTLLILVGFVYGIHQKLTLRTAIFAVPFSVTMIFLWIWALRKNPLWLYALPPLLILWSNLHGSYRLGIGLFALFASGLLLDRLLLQETQLPRIRTVVICLLLTGVGVTFIHPFPLSHSNIPVLDFTGTAGSNAGSKSGLPDHNPKTIVPDDIDPSASLTVQITQSLRNLIFSPRPARSVEFQSPFRRTEILFVWVNLLIAGGLLLAYVFSRSYRSFTWSLTIPGLLFVSLSTLRTIGYVTLIGLPIALFLLPYSGKTLLKTKLGLYLRSFFLAGTLGLVTAFLVTGEIDHFTGFGEQKIGIGPIRKFSTDVPRYALNEHSDTRMFNGYSIGSYLIWRWWPYKKVFQDTKISAYHPRFQLLRTALSPGQLLNRYELDLAVLERINPLTKDYFLPEAEWEPLRMDEGLILFQYVKREGTTQQSP